MRRIDPRLAGPRAVVGGLALRKPMIQFTCPRCSRLLQVADETAGAFVACPQCKQPMKAPAATTVVPPAPPIAPASESESETYRVLESHDEVGLGSRPHVGSQPPDRIVTFRFEDYGTEGDEFDAMVRSTREGEDEVREEKYLKKVPAWAPPEVRDLGVPSGCYQSASYETYMRERLMLLVLAGVFLSCAGAFSTKKGVLIGFLLLIVFLGVSAALGYLVWKVGPRFYRRVTVLLYPDGFVWIQGQCLEVCYWDEIDAVWQDVTRVVNQYDALLLINHIYTVVRTDGRKFVFKGAENHPSGSTDEIDRIEYLGMRIMRNATRALPVVLAQLAEGQSLPFGPVELDTEGLYFDGEEVPWKAVRCRVRRGEITLGSKQARLTIPFRKMPNPILFLALVEAMQAAQK
jgi:hypothetical protein